MVLGFKKQFVERIKEGSKIHTIREDKNNRWKDGSAIHFATGVRTKNYNQFFSGICLGIQYISVIYPHPECDPSVYVDGKEIEGEDLLALCRNDGFETKQDFFDWFDKDFDGKIIHWTRKRYE